MLNVYACSHFDTHKLDVIIKDTTAKVLYQIDVVVMKVNPQEKEL